MVPHALEAVAEVVAVIVQEALLLNEIDEHHAVEHEGGVPVPVALGGDAVYEVTEGGQFRPETLVEALGHLLHVQGRADAGRGDLDGQTRFLFNIKGQALQTLEHVVSALPRIDGIFAAGYGLAALPLDPLPDLRLATSVGEDDEVLERALGDCALYLAADRVLRDVVVDAGVALVDDEPRLLRDRLQGIVAPVNLDAHRLRWVVVPAQALHEEAREIEVPQVGTEALRCRLASGLVPATE